MQVASLFATLLGFASASIIQNGQLRENPYPGQTPAIALDESWRTYAADAVEIGYKGRWDSKHISWWSAPGAKFDFTGNQVALGFGPQTSEGVLVAYRIAGLDWEFSNVTADSVHQFVGPETGVAAEQTTFELRVTNWAYGVQLNNVSVGVDAQLRKSPEFGKNVEIIGDSLASGQYGTYEGLSSWAFAFAAGLGNVEYSITAYPGICLQDKECYDNARGMTYQWNQASDCGARAKKVYGTSPEKWNVSDHRAADLVVINLGTNDHRKGNEVAPEDFYDSYVKLIEEVHEAWPQANIIIMSLWGTFDSKKDTYVQVPLYVRALKRVFERFRESGFVHYFDTTGILHHNDVNPKDHPTDVGHIKIASHLMQFVKLRLGWEFAASGPEVEHDTLYWNDEAGY
ncbi:acetylxylan esterase [Aspergillus campestris IBT 28561]|uniref:Acetylxylan esterase n=1 Tax=Aspergillus campestris (strain IBT 28561) TaxID=1392248 RepID=A0A2I1D749_ASPC2|nr:acetylxylan esterase [Aspergillus campestris IBT 28561]PKY05706.1 acetylxylan esterase [Aspergillus campestris IBT 28561]